MNLRLSFALITLFWLASLSGCALFSKDEAETLTAEQYFAEGEKALKDEDYETAIKKFEELEAHYPFGPVTQQAQLKIAYAYYKFREPESAIAAAERFIKLYPRHAEVDYAYYLKGLASFPREPSAIDKLFSTELVMRDPRPALESFQYFGDLIKRYPDSQYVADARQRMIFLRNKLADYELEVAQYYMKRGAYIAVVNRAQYILEHYNQTPAIPAALALMAEAYQHLGMNDLAQDTLRILATNAPQHPALKRLEKKSAK